MLCTQALPLRRSWVYSHVPLNTAIRARRILGETYTALPDGKNNIQPHIIKYWSRVVDLQQRMFRPHARHSFKGFTMTGGGFILAVQRTNNSTDRRRKRGRPRQQADCEYIVNLSQVTQQSTAGQCVVVNPGRHNLLYMRYEGSTMNDKSVYRYTRNQQLKETWQKKHKTIRE
ncbi:hypothetical protein IW136_006273 [Coemansia sp. RSA 678]|nr:hypothetical protein IW136_006273 [Coemansia sp. RSA 678]